MENSKIKEKLLSSNKNSRLEKFGKSLTFLCIALIVFVVGAILVFVAQKGLSTFYSDGVNPFRFLFAGERSFVSPGWIELQPLCRRPP